MGFVFRFFQLPGIRQKHPEEAAGGRFCRRTPCSAAFDGAAVKNLQKPLKYRDKSFIINALQYGVSNGGTP